MHVSSQTDLGLIKIFSDMKSIKHFFLARPLVLLSALALFLALGWATFSIVSVDDAAATADNARIVVVGTEKALSTPGVLRGTLVAGTFHDGAHVAEVLSDRDCAPDADGISHCLNELDLGSTRITIRHHHRMNEVPCLSPGETVRVMDAATYADHQES